MVCDATVATSANLTLLSFADIWDREQERKLNFLDTKSGSRLLVTTRIQGLLPGADEYQLGQLEPNDACALLLETAGLPYQEPPFPDL